MEQFKAVEKEMKTKAYSKEGLSQNAKQDPEEKRREELCDFLATQLDEIEQFIEAMDAEQDTLQAAVKKKKNDSSKSGRLAEIDVVLERFKWHEGKIQLLLRSLQNGNVDNEQVEELKDSIEYALKEGREAEFESEDPDLYEGLNLDGEEAVFGMGADNDKISSQDALSIQDEADSEPPGLKKVKTEAPAVRRPSTQMKSPLPVLASLNTMPPPPSIPKDSSMKPAPAPTRPPGEALKYASAAAAAAVSDKSGVGIAPLPPPPPAAASPTPAPAPALVPLPAPSKASIATSPLTAPIQPATKAFTEEAASTNGTSSHDQSKSPTLSQASARALSVPSSVPPTPALEKAEKVSTPLIASSGFTPNNESTTSSSADPEESIYHLPASLQDLIQSFETTKLRIPLQPNPSQQRLLAASRETCPDAPDAERPHHYRPQLRFNTPAHYPQEPLPIFDDPALYETGRIDTDTLFYIFYYRQGTYQQYLAAKSLKNQSWRFHKQYQTWFQRHEEPKTITEEFEQGTYRFFDYESTW
jgi:CCR4-NOT transcription complex subunit 3